MDPQPFIRLSVGSLGLRVSGEAYGIHNLTSPCVCEIRLRGFPAQTSPILFISSPESTPNAHSIASSFYLEESGLKALLAPRCFHPSHPSLEIVVYSGWKGSHCGVGNKRQNIGTFKINVGPEWGEGKSVILHNGWISIGRNRLESGTSGVELHSTVKLDPDPRYVFRFEDETKLSPQIVQLQGTSKQSIFSCKFSQDRAAQVDPLGGNFWSTSVDGSHLDIERRERKGWKVKIHDLSGSAVAAAFITTPFVPSTGCDWVAKSNPGAWLIVRSDACRSESWQPWGKLEAWRERGVRDIVCCRFHLLSEGGEFLMSELLMDAEKGGQFFIDTDRQARSPLLSPQSSGDFAALGPIASGFVMCCEVRGEGKCSKPLVQLAVRHVTCVEDAAIFMALAAAVDLSMEACRPFHRRPRRKNRSA